MHRTAVRSAVERAARGWERLIASLAAPEPKRDVPAGPPTGFVDRLYLSSLPQVNDAELPRLPPRPE